MLVVSACQPAAPAADSGDDRYGGNLKVGVASIVHLDPNDVNQYGLNEIVQLFYETLFDRNEDGEVVPLLIKEVSQSDDGLVHTWKLHEGVKFHDGSDFNAEAVKWNVMRKIDEEKPMGSMLPISNMKVVDDHTLEITLSRLYTGMYNILAVKTFSIYSPSFYEEVGSDGIKTQASGTGPFKVDSYTPNEKLELVKNDDYWQDGLPYLDSVTIMEVADANTRATMLEAGEIHVAVGTSIQSLEQLKLDENIKVLTGPSSRHYYVSMTNIYEPLDDKRVRQAFNYAIDKEGILEAAFKGYATVADVTIVNEAVSGYSPAATHPYPYDTDKATALLAEAGWTDSDGDGILDKDGEPMELILRTRKGAVPGDYETAELVQGMLLNVGVKVNVDVADTASFLAELNQPIEDAPHYDMVNLTWGTFTGDAEYVMKSYVACDAAPPKYWDYSHYCNEEVDALIAKGDEVPTVEERNEIYAQILDIIREDAPTLFLFNGLSTIATRSDVNGLYLDPAQTIWPVKYAWLD
jgi:ABC-type transport system substrate-binding protein